MTILNDSPKTMSHIPPSVNGSSGKVNGASPSPLAASTGSKTPLLQIFLNFHNELENYKSGKTIQIDGEHLTVPAIVAAARYSVKNIALSSDPAVRARVDKSRKLIDDKIAAGKSIYGVSTGFGGSADTRTDQHNSLGMALLQHQHIGILPSNLGVDIHDEDGAEPLLPPSSTSMPSPWVRGAMVVRTNSLIRGHSGVRWALVESMMNMLKAGVVPVVPLRGSISASGDLSPLSYIAGALMGFSNIFVRCPSQHSEETNSVQRVLPANEALPQFGLKPLTLIAKEHLGILNGTSFSASVGGLIAYETVGAVILSEVLTAMGTEALLGTQANFAAFISDVRPHPGQIEASTTLFDLLSGSSLASPAAAHTDEVTIDEDAGELRQDRYPLRTAPQWIGPLIEDILATVKTVEIEVNSTTDNPLLDPGTGYVHHGGNFQALSLTTAFEKSRLAIFLLGKILFSQATELLNPAFNRGLSPSVAATDPSLNYHAKGLDIAMASYVSELGWLANNVATNVQSAEMHNQSVNSLALISGRATLSALEVLNMLFASYLYVLCQALDLRAFQKNFHEILSSVLNEELATHMTPLFSQPESSLPKLHKHLLSAIRSALDSTTTMDTIPRFHNVVGSCTTPIFDALTHEGATGNILATVSAFRTSLAIRLAKEYQTLQEAFVNGTSSPPASFSGTDTFNPKAPASLLLGRTRPVYEYVRLTLGVETHGLENWRRFSHRGVHGERGIGRSVSIIYEAIRDGKMQGIIVGAFGSKLPTNGRV
ncbi:hypothetical protein M422DRAFT_26717 [Sphaerobolus stellatus SS14]|nr:hypothetical protein M422DRAFT_26717 [Sphaerobolus stellatus SS14]